MAKSKKFYSESMRLLRKLGAVNFDYDLRKPLTSGQKSNISKAVNQLGTALKGTTSKRFFAFKKKGDAKKAKESMGQTGTLLRGVVKTANKNTKAKIVDGELVFTTKTNITTIRETVQKIPPSASASLGRYLKRHVQSLRNSGFTQLELVFSNGTTSGVFGLELKSHMDALFELTDSFAERYGENSDTISAIIIR